jgi:HK97 family phage prohead protease/HK97 family phage major capsid protein
MKQNKFHLDALFSIEKAANSDDSAPEKIKIVGYANTVTKDRMGDVIMPDAWTKGALTNYLKNPILLAFHNHSKPAGKVTSLVIDENGLKIEAEVSTAAKDVYEFVKDGVLRAFSIGASIKDAIYDRETDTFFIKDLELLEVSIVSVPANQDSLFSLAKGFESEEDFSEFKKQFLPNEDVTKKLPDSAGKNDKEEINMDKEQIEQMIKDVAAATLKASQEAQVAKDLEMKKAAEAVTAVKDNTEALLAEVTKRFEDRMAAKDLDISKTIEGLQGALKEKGAEIEAMLKSKMSFSEPNTQKDASVQDKETAILLGKLLRKGVDETKFGKSLVTKANASVHGVHVTGANGGDWEIEVSNNMIEDLRRKLVLAPLFRNIAMPLSVMRFPVNPEAGNATWVNTTSYGTTASTGAAATHALGDITLSTHKLATKEFINVEEEEDTILPLIPIIRDAIVRRMARSHDVALLRGAASEYLTSTSISIEAIAASPFKGLVRYAVDNSNLVSVAATAACTVATLISLRKKLGVLGLDPADLKFIVSTDAYYDLLEDTLFQDSSKIGADKNVLLTGQVGSVLGIPVILSGEFKTKVATNYGAVCVYTGNFIHGEQRGLTLESEYRIEEQAKMLVATRRLAFQQVGTVNGGGVSALKWV